jgi:protein TonB
LISYSKVVIKLTGAYELRKSNRKTTIKALILGAIFFSIALAAPLIIDLLPKGAEEDMDRDIKITAIKLPPRRKNLNKCSTTTTTTTKSGSG